MIIHITVDLDSGPISLNSKFNERLATHELLLVDVWLCLARVTLNVTHWTHDQVVLLQLGDAVLAERVLTRQYVRVVVHLRALRALHHHLRVCTSMILQWLTEYCLCFCTLVSVSDVVL